jgi:transposase-like protein
LECKGCSYQVPATAGTVFHGFRKPLRMWFKAIFLMTSQKTVTSAKNLMRQLGLASHQTAWTWLHSCGWTVRPDRERLSGQVKVDEGYVGGLEEAVHGRETKTKSVVAVAVEVKDRAPGRLRMAVVEDVSAQSLGGFVTHSVAEGSTVRTDGWGGYAELKKRGYRHRPRVVGDPKRASRLFPHVHRGLSLLKRWLLGAYQGAVHPTIFRPTSTSSASASAGAAPGL